MKRRQWSPADDATLREMMAADRTRGEIAEALQRTVGSVKERSHHLRISLSPESLRRARSAAASALAADPLFRAKHAIACKHGWRNADERRAEARKKSIERDTIGLCRRVLLADPEKHAARIAKARASMLKISAARIAWCPEERRDEYRKLMHSFGAAEARRRIESTMTAFERTLAKARAGEIRLVERTYAPASSGSFDTMTESRG